MMAAQTVAKPRRFPYTGPETADGKPAPRNPRIKHHPAPGRMDGRGLDLAHHYHEIRACVLGSYTIRCERQGVDPDDLISVVSASVLMANRGASAYDPERASVMRYVHVLCSSRLSHLAVSCKARREAEQVGLRVLRGGSTIEVDAAEAEHLPGGIGADPAAVVARLLPALIEQARVLDEADPGAGTGSTLDLFGSWQQGWREQAIRWVVAESPDVADAAAWWRVAVGVAVQRFEWARGMWAEAIGV